MSSPPTDEPTHETVQEHPSQTLRQKIVAKLHGLPEIPLGLRLFPIVFLCNFIEISQAEIVILSSDWWTLCIPWSVKRNTWKCSEAGGGITLAVIIQYGWPVTGGSILLSLRDLLTSYHLLRSHWSHYCSSPIQSEKSSPTSSRSRPSQTLDHVLFYFSLLGALLARRRHTLSSPHRRVLLQHLCHYPRLQDDVISRVIQRMAQLAIVLGAYKASSAVSYVFVRWIMKNVGFQALLPILVVCSGALGFYTWSPYIAYYPSEDNQGRIVAQHAVSSPPLDRTEGARDIISAESSHNADERRHGEDESPESTQTPSSGASGYLTDHTKLLKTSYFLGVFATGFLDPIVLPNDHPDEAPYDRVCPLARGFTLETLILYLVAIPAEYAEYVTSRALEEQLNVNRGVSIYDLTVVHIKLIGLCSAVYNFSEFVKEQ
ncbi:170_t:CDS:2, partial [Acaulospora colombiana]